MRSHPVILKKSGRKQGAGFSNYECVPGGNKLSFEIIVPGRGAFTPSELVKWLVSACSSPLRGLGSSGAKYGRIEFQGFEFLGLLKDDMPEKKSAQAEALANANKADGHFA